MFKTLFGYKEEVQDNYPVQLLEPQKKEIPKVIDSKHIAGDMMSTLDALLAEAGVKYTKETQVEDLKKKLEAFKAENAVLYKKIKLLKELGFASTPATVTQKKQLEAREAEVNKEISKLNNEIVKYQTLETDMMGYALKYPGFKFIPTEVMNKVLKKYNLMLGDTHFYSKEIPMEALEIASQFMEEIKKSKKIIDVIRRTSSWSFSRGSETYHVRERLASSQEQYRTNAFRAMDLERHHYDTIVTTLETSCLKIVAPMDHFTIPEIDFRDSDDNTIKVPIVSISERNHLKIDVDKLNALAIEKAKKMKILDPILQLEVPGGYIILKAWDKEADIIEIQNETLN